MVEHRSSSVNAAKRSSLLPGISGAAMSGRASWSSYHRLVPSRSRRVRATYHEQHAHGSETRASQKQPTACTAC